MAVHELDAVPASVSRAERRSQTRQLILDAARELFAERGYLETTIRAIAQRADVDPALVMQHFGAKSALFDAVSGIPITLDDALEGPPEQLGERLLRHALADVDRKDDRTMPVLRSMLTHPEAAHAVRCAIMNPETSPWTRVLVGPDAERRSALIGTLVLGVLVARYMVHIPGVSDAAGGAVGRVGRTVPAPAGDGWFATRSRRAAHGSGRAGRSGCRASGRCRTGRRVRQDRARWWRVLR